MKILSNGLRFLRTVRYLKIQQIIWLLIYKIKRPNVHSRPTPALRTVETEWTFVPTRENTFKGNGTFHILNKTGKIKNAKDWNAPDQDKLWLYNLHYFDFLNSKREKEKDKQTGQLIDQWIEENPIHVGNGWEPYPLSLRIVNLIKWFLSGNQPEKHWLDNLAIQIRTLSSSIEYHILGNHILSNSKALVFAGLYFKGDEADQWLKLGLKLLKEQVSEQILDDGGHFERSPMYHSLVLEDMLDLCNLVQCYENNLPPELEIMANDWPNLILKMRHWLYFMCHPDNEISFFNDATFKVAASIETLEQYALSLKHPKRSHHAEAMIVLKSTGYVNVRQTDMQAILNVGSVGPVYQAGHAHADSLSFEMSLFGKRVFVNSGISQYGVDEERHKQRGTLAHNTVTINGENSSEIWSGFRVGRRARVDLMKYQETSTGVYIAARHDGYKWLHPKLTHKRQWHFKNGALAIEDQIEGPFNDAIAMFHLSPNVKVKLITERHAKLALSEGKVIDFHCNGGNIASNKGNWNSEFGVSANNQNLSIHFLEPTLKINMVWS